MQGMCLCLVYHVCNTILTYCWLPSVFFRWFAHGLVKPIGNSTKWTQSAVKRKAFEHGAKSMVTESAIRVIEIARCLFSKQTNTAGPQWTTLPCFTPMMNYGKFMKIPYRMGAQWYIKAYYDEIVPIKRCWQHCLHIEVAQLILVVTTTVNTLELGSNDLAFVLSQCGYTIQYNGMYIIYQHWDNGW